MDRSVRQILWFLLFYILTVLPPLSLLARGPEERWTPDSTISFRHVGGTAISPDGQLIAYTVSAAVFSQQHSEYRTHIWVVSSDGTLNYQFTRGTHSCFSPAFSPDGKYLSFLANRDESGTYQIWLLRLTGGEAIQLTRADSDILKYAWSPDGKQVAYLAREASGVPENSGDAEPTYLFVMSVERNPAEQGLPQKLTSEPFKINGFDWSPDGQTIVFDHRSKSRAGDWSGADISTVSVSGGPVKPLVTWPGPDTEPKYARDSKWLAFRSTGAGLPDTSAQAIYIMPAAGGRPESLAPTPLHDPHLLDWSPDSKGVYLEGVDHTYRHLFLLPKNGHTAEFVTRGEGNFTWASISRSANQMAFIYETADLAPDVYVTEIDGFKPRKLTNINADLSGIPMARTEVVKWYSKDRSIVEGLLTYPLYYQIDRRYPLLLIINSSPDGVFTDTYTARSSVYPLQALAHAGYAILRANPRGGLRAGQNSPAAGAGSAESIGYDDLMSGVNKVVGLGVAHPDSLCIAGWDYGAYVASVIVAKTNRFKAASIGTGISRFVEMAETGKTDEVFFDVQNAGSEAYPPLSVDVDQIRTPIQILYPQNSDQAFAAHMRAFYHNLESTGHPVEQAPFASPSDGPPDPELIVRLAKEMVSWFDRSLGKSREPVVAK